MPRAFLPIATGQVTNLKPYELSDRSESLINWMVNEAGGLVSRPGIKSYKLISGTVYTVLGYSYAVTPEFIFMAEYNDSIVLITNDGLFYAVDSDSNYIVKGEIIDVVPGLTPTSVISSKTGDLLIATGSTIYRWDGSNLPERLVVDGKSPAATHIAVCNGYLVANNNGTDEVYWSTTTDHSDFDFGARVFRAESLNDPVSCMLEIDQKLYLLGTDSIDVYYPTRSTNPAFARSHSIKLGLASPGAAIDVDGVLYMLDDRRRIIRIIDRAPEVISFEIERTLKELNVVSDAAVYRIDIDGKHLLMWVFESDETALVYEYALSKPGASIWSEWKGRSSGKWTPPPIRSYVYHQAWNKHFSSKWNDNHLYEMSTDYEDDGDEGILRIVKTGAITHGATFRKRCVRLRIKAARGRTAIIDSDEQGYDPILLVRWKDEDGRWVDWSEVSLGEKGDVYLYGEISCLGTYRERRWEFRTAEPIPRLSIMSIEEEFEVLTR